MWPKHVTSLSLAAVYWYCQEREHHFALMTNPFLKCYDTLKVMEAILADLHQIAFLCISSWWTAQCLWSSGWERESAENSQAFQKVHYPDISIHRLELTLHGTWEMDDVNHSHTSDQTHFKIQGQSQDCTKVNISREKLSAREEKNINQPCERNSLKKYNSS